MDEMERCEIIDAICPYEHGCNVCRLQNDYEDAMEKSSKLLEKMEGSKG